MTDQTHRQALPEGFMLQEYQLGRVLGQGGFGLTYLGWDTALDKAVAVKEYLPNELAVREANHSVAAKSGGDEDNFKWGLSRVLFEARTLARFKHPNIVPVYRCFEAHGTAYIVMEFVEGETLGDYLKRAGRPKESFLRAVLAALLDGLSEVHRAGFMHRDIKPGNIILNTEGAPVLVDFGSARQEVGGRSRSITSVVTPGYAPIEQYSTRGKQGPWTDIYALGAVAYRAVTGAPPPDATERVLDDSMVPAVEAGLDKYSAEFLRAIDSALAVNSKDRLQDVDAWRRALRQNDLREERWKDGTVATGRYVDGKRHGHWVIRLANGGVKEGPVVEGKEHGHWVYRWPNGDAQEGSFVDGKKHGHWVVRFVAVGVQEGTFVDGKRHGHWAERFADGRVMDSDYVNGKRHGLWVTRDANGTVVERKRYENGKLVAGKSEPTSKPKTAAQQTKISMIYERVMTIGSLASLATLLPLVIYLRWGVAGLSVAVLLVAWVISLTQKALAKNLVKGEILGYLDVVAIMLLDIEWDGDGDWVADGMQGLRHIESWTGWMLRAFWNVAVVMLGAVRVLFWWVLFTTSAIFILAWFSG